MSKIIRLTESDLTRIIKRVISEGFGTNEKTEYIVKRGDSLSKIAIKFNTTVSELAKVNNIKNINNISVGQKIIIPQGSNQNQTTNKTTNKTPGSGFILVFSFPDYRPSVENNWINRNIVKPISSIIANEDSSGGSSTGKKMIKLDKVGHGGCVIITSDGNATLYEFGRYKRDDVGNVIKKRLGKIAKIQNGKLINAKSVATSAKLKTEGDGPKLAMDVVVLNLPNPVAAINFADVEQRDYVTADPMRGGAMNCGTYSLEVAIAGGVESSFKCFASPVGVVDHLKPGLGSFTV